jgi:hypothetical protein
MANRIFFGNGDESVRGRVDVRQIGPDCYLFVANHDEPPVVSELPFALAQVLQKWMQATGVRVRTTLPIVKAGDTIALFVWADGS